jgi:hypothetical protein
MQLLIFRRHYPSWASTLANEILVAGCQLKSSSADLSGMGAGPWGLPPSPRVLLFGLQFPGAFAKNYFKQSFWSGISIQSRIINPSHGRLSQQK